ncbi:UvrB/UvrC motif-containing protein [Bacillus alveayuensis]|jgi:protein arginine kinase activator|uniref:Protein arginine kinase activator n=1 Tax=Aeribacillus alveayuensis TaxID=279215 RepID=A0ABT9VRE4_9BACI|nr:UvrB/UvrC motif-containing protein [Bacillus alveayuensis]MDQ0163541.1 protein arginine kinase activator [Bacillus alveayuensis]
MICQECNERPATFHFTKIINGEKTEVHICEQCAQEKGDMFKFYSNPGFSINNLLSGLLNLEPSLAKQGQTVFQNNHVLQCERCKMTFSQFTKVGRFGCSNCYKTFQQQINPILKRVHSGNTVHGGKIPKRIGGSIHLRKRLKQLKEDLQQLVAHEEFEKAAEVRDEIRMIEAKLKGPNGEGI